MQGTATTIDAATIAAVVGTTLGIVVAAVTASTAYLRLFVAKTAGDLKEAIGKTIDAGYARKDTIDDIERRITILETRAERRDAAEERSRG